MLFHGLPMLSNTINIIVNYFRLGCFACALATFMQILASARELSYIMPLVMRSLLLCPPDYYGIEYEINPWMDRTRNADSDLARAQWRGLLEKLQSLGCDVELVAPRKKLPDMVFTANAGLLLGNKFIRSNFRFPQRQGEEEHFEKWFANRGYEIVRLTQGLFFEGEGDALFCGDILFCGYRFRSDIRSHQIIGEQLKKLVISVELVKDRFYHLDTCFCPLPDGSAIWHPDAF